MNIFSIFTKAVMKAFFLVAVLVLSVSVASAQSTNSVLLHHVREANLVIKDRTNTLSATHLDTLRQRLEQHSGRALNGIF